MFWASVIMIGFIVMFSFAVSYDGQRLSWRQFVCMVVLATMMWFIGLSF